MEDPVFNATITVGGNGSTYRFDALSKMMHSNQSFILELTFIKPASQGGGAYDISGSVATLFVSTVNNSDPNNVFTLDGGVITDSGSGTDDRVTFTVVKDLIPDSLGGVPFRSLNKSGASTGGNSVFYFILEDADSILEFSEGVNIIDPNFAGPGTVEPGAGSIVVSKNDLGSVLDIALTTPPAADLGVNYIIPVGATGDWSGHDNEYATGNGSDWLFTIPVDGNFVFNETTNLQTRFNAGVWFVDTDLVTSVFTRTGDVVFEAGDATAALITNVAAGNIIAVTVQAAIDELDANDDIQQTAINLNTSHAANTSNPHATDADDVGRTTAQWNADQLLGKTIAAAASTPSNEDVLSFNTSTQEWEPGTVPGGGGGGRPAFESNFDTDILGAEPASGAVKFDNATPGSVTTIRASTTDVNGINITNQLSSVGSGDAFIVYQIDDTTRFLYFSVTSSSLVTTSYDIVGTSISGGVAIESGKSCGIAAYILTTGGASGVASFNGRTGPVFPGSLDYPSTLIADASLFGGPTVEDSFNAVFNTLSPFAVAAGVDNIQAGVAYTLVLTDKDNTNIVMTSALSNEITIPTNASVAMPLAVKIPYLQKGVGVTTITGDVGVTVNGVSGGSVVVNNQFQGGVMWQITANDWVIPGDIT